MNDRERHDTAPKLYHQAMGEPGGESCSLCHSGTSTDTDGALALYNHIEREIRDANVLATWARVADVGGFRYRVGVRNRNLDRNIHVSSREEWDDRKHLVLLEA